MAPQTVGRYVLHGEIAAGGMATVHYAQLLGPSGFSRVVAIKRLHAQFAKDPDFVALFFDEARLAARIRHPNVVATLDVVTVDDEVLLVMDYIEGETLARLGRVTEGRGIPIPLEVTSAVLSDALHGLHAAHEVTDDRGRALCLVHRDVSPQNVLVGADGVARVLDFGVAKAVGRARTTAQGELKGKIAYMAPEQLSGRPLDRRADVYAAGVVLWEMLTLRRLFVGDSAAEVAAQVLAGAFDAGPLKKQGVPDAVQQIVRRALDREPSKRFESAEQMASALEAAAPVASRTRVASWVKSVAADALAQRARRVRELESGSGKVEREAPKSTDGQVTKVLGAAERTPIPRSGPRFGATPSGRKEPRTKGSNVKAFVKALAEIRGEKVVEETLRRVSPELAEALQRGIVVPGGWYPVAWYGDLHDSAAAVTAEGMELAHEIGRVTTRLHFKGIYQIITYVLSPQSIVAHAQRAFSTFFDTGKVEIVEARANYVCANFKGCTGYTARLWEDMLGADEMLIELAGGKDARSRVLSGGGNLPNMTIEHTWR